MVVIGYLCVLILMLMYSYSLSPARLFKDDLSSEDRVHVVDQSVIMISGAKI